MKRCVNPTCQRQHNEPGQLCYTCKINLDYLYRVGVLGTPTRPRGVIHALPPLRKEEKR